MTTPTVSLAPVVVVVDRGGAAAAVRFGAAESLRTGRPLSLVHVAPVGDGWLWTIGRDSLRMAVERADAEVAGRVRVDSALLRGSLTAEVARDAATAALVVVEQQPPGALRRPEEASTAAALAEVIDVPVAVVPTDWIERHRRVVTVGLGPSAADDSALTSAMTLARLRGAALRVLVADPYSRDVVDERLQRLGGDGCDLAVEPYVGEPSTALAEASRTSDLVVVGRHRPQRPGGSRLGSLGWKLLDDLVCPVLLTRPFQANDRPEDVAETSQAKEQHMYARAGDRIVIRSAHLGGPVRDGEVIGVEHADGRPPYRVRWSDTGHESLFFPGPDAHIDHDGPAYQPEYDVPEAG